MTAALTLRIRDLQVWIAEAWTRMPFRYGNACLTAVPLLHLAADVESPRGAMARGLSGDCLPPRWFDKDPEKTFRQNVKDQLAAVRIACEAYRDCSGADSVFSLWQRAHPETLRRAVETGLNRLTASFGSSLVERALLDAACRLAGLSFHEALKRRVLGYESGPELPARPLDMIQCRHTVGLGDHLRGSEIPADERIDDGLPQALDEDIETYGLRYFKVKVRGDHEADLDRLRRLSEVLAEHCAGAYSISLDGNEQYRDLTGLARLLDDLATREPGSSFVSNVLYIEQPLDRAIALDPGVESDLRRLAGLKPVIIDESDDRLDAFERAIAMGYTGCSVKNCKGVFKALLNRRHCHQLNHEARAERYFQTGEDLANLPVLPFQQDLATLASLGIDHAERNGHHYFRGLGHLPDSERLSAARSHSDLYRHRGSETFLRIDGGRMGCASLQRPGYGYDCEINLPARIPLDSWSFDRLRMDASE